MKPMPPRTMVIRRYNGKSAAINGAVKRPTSEQLTMMARKGVPIDRVAVVAETTNDKGQTIRIAADENGDVVATEQRPNIAPLAIAGALAWLLLS